MKEKIDKQVNYVRSVGNMSKKGLEKQIEKLQNEVKSKKEELENKDNEIKGKIEK